MLVQKIGAFFTHRLPKLRKHVHKWRDERRLMNSPITTSRLGFKFGGNPQMVDGSFEASETVLLKKAIEMNNVFVDIGANVGYYTCIALSKKKHVISFEPLAANLDILYKNLLANGWKSNVEIFPIGLSGDIGMLEIYGRDTGASLIKNWSNNKGLDPEIIPVNKLDNVILNTLKDKKVLIKIDVEGAEYNVLLGASEILSLEPKPMLFLEIALDYGHPGLNPNYTKTFDLLWKYGYQVFSITGNLVTPELISKWNSEGECEWGCANWIAVSEKQCVSDWFNE